MSDKANTIIWALLLLLAHLLSVCGQVPESNNKSQDTVGWATVIGMFKGPGQDEFTCHFPALAPANLSLEYRVLWVVNGEWISPTPQHNMTVLPNDFSYLQYGTSLQCAVSVCESSRCSDTPGSLTFSGTYTAEIQINNLKNLTINEGELGEEMTIQVTAPPYVLCRGQMDNNTDLCDVSVSVSTSDNGGSSFCPDGTHVPQTSVMISKDGREFPSCRIKFTNDDWQSNYSVRVRAVTDQVYDGVHILTQDVLIQFLSENYTVQNQTVYTVQLTVVDQDSDALCSSVNDPHITTFDGRLIHNFYEGEFILYRHKTLPYEVRVFYRRCAGRASCNCALAARAGDDVIIVDKCGASNDASVAFHPMNVQLFKKGSLTPGFNIYSQYEGREYRIVFPSGTTLYVERSAIKSYNYINVWLKPSPLDRKHTEGLCGPYDGDVTNDLTYPNGTVRADNSSQPLDYLRSWRVNPSDTYYTGACDRGNLTTISQTEKQPSSCYCREEATQICGDGFHLTRCSYMNINETDITSRLESQALFPLKCLRLDYVHNTLPSFQYNVTYSPGVIDTTQPSPSGSSYIEFQSQCQFNLAYEMSPYDLVRKCKDVSGVRLQNIVASCALDLYMSNDISWIKAAVQSIKVQCQLQLERNSSLWLGNPPGLPEDYTDVLCLANCGGAGTCRKGVCLCQTSYGGSDCFVKTDEPANLFQLSNGGFCDLRVDSCDQVIVYNNNTVNEDELSCFMTHMQTNATGTYLTGSGLVSYPAIFLTVNQLACPVPGSGTYQVQVGSKASLASSPAYLFVYDSRCFNCHVTNQTCFQKETACLIGGVCYEKGEYKPGSPRQYCDPTFSTDSWQTANDSCQGLALLWLETSLESAGYGPGGQPSEAGDREACKLRCLAMSGDGASECLAFDFNSSSSSCSYHGSPDLASSHDYGISDHVTSRLEWLCENNPCGQKNVTWMQRLGFAILPADGAEIRGVNSSVECRKLCLEETSFVCRSAQLLLEASLCVLSPRTSILAGHDFVRWPGYVFQEWICDTDDEPLLPTANPVASIQRAPNDGQDEYTLACQIEVARSNSSMQAHIMWLIDELVAQESTVWTNNSRSSYTTYMDRSSLTQLAYGTQLACGMRLCYNDSCTRTMGAFRRSNTISLSFQVTSAPTLTVTEGQQGEVITVISHTPPAFLCATHNTSADCTFLLSVRVSPSSRDLGCPNSGSMAQIAFAAFTSAEANHSAVCGQVLTASSWQRAIRFPVVATLDQVQDLDETRQVIMTASLVDTDGLTVTSHELRPVQVTAVNRDLGAVCVASNDPHLTTFDNRDLSVYYEGEFVQYAHTSLPYEVRAFYRGCPSKSRGSCICAVAVRSDDDVLLIDQCRTVPGAHRQPVSVRLYMSDELTHGTSVRRIGGGLKYEMTLPTGTTVEVEVKAEHLVLLVVASAADFNSTRGLCGLYDGVNDTVLVKSDSSTYDRAGLTPDEFSLSWRQQTNASLYGGYCGSSQISQPPTAWCPCLPEAGPSCRVHGEFTSCPKDNGRLSYWTGEDITSLLISRASRPSCGTDRPVFEYNPNLNAGEANWTTISNLTEDAAREVCTQTILNTTAGSRCASIMPERFNSLITSCIKDVQLSDDQGWALSTLSVVISLCRIQTFTDLSLWVNSSGQLTPDVSLIDTLCFNQCSGQGSCQQGACVCTEGYGLADCSVDLSQPPAVFFLANDGLCDMTRFPCGAIGITGATFALSENLVCKLQPVKIAENEVLDHGDAVLVPADYFSPTEVTCVAPALGSYRVQISNDNHTFSDMFVHTVFHPQCHTCSSGGHCSLTLETCFIDNQCYMYGQENAENGSLVCDSYQSYDSWSPRKDYPYVGGKPRLTTSYNNTSTQLLFLCEVPVSYRPRVIFLVEWLHNAQPVSNVSVGEVGHNSSTVSLNAQDIPQFAYGSNVSCQLTACFAENCTVTKSPPESSERFTAGIQIVDKTLTITEGRPPGYVDVQSTVPPELLCAGDDWPQCQVFVSVAVVAARELTCPGSQVEIPQLVFQLPDTEGQSAPACGVRYVHWPGLVSVGLVAVLDSLLDGDRVRQVEVSVRVEYNLTVQVSEVIGTQQVTVVDRDSSTLCTSLNDPHMRTFDNRFYNVFKEGEFILYKHALLPFEVHTFYRKCNRNRASCNCAVTIKSGDDVILFDRCGAVPSGRTPPLQVQLYLNGNLTEDTYIIQELEGRKYRVILPTGTEVKIVVTSSFLNVWLQSSAADVNSTMGLCGNCNGNASDDLTMPSGAVYSGHDQEPDTFSLSWSVNATQSHFRGICASDSDPPSRAEYCRCSSDGRQALCQPGLKVSMCLPSGDSPKTNGQGTDLTAYFTRHSVPSLGCQPDIQFEYDSNYTSPNFSWPTASNWTLESARTFCEKFLSTSVGVKCIDTFSVDYTSTVESCVSDIQIMGDTSYAVDALSSIVEQCLSRVTRDVNLWVDRKPDVSVLGLMCLYNCNGHGNCSDGVCACQQDFAGVDCSVNLTAPPSCEYLLPHQPCDVEREDCRVVTVVGGPFVDSPDLACVVQEIDYQFLEAVTTNSTTLVEATFISYERVVCVLPFLASFNISVRNRKSINSLPVTLQVYSSRCFQCNSSRCSIQPKWCFINSTCYHVTDWNPDSPNLVCEPDRSISKWTDRNEFPSLTAQLNLQADFDVQTSLFAFTCDWSAHLNNNQTQLTVFAQWYRDDDLVLETVVGDGVSRTVITHTQITGLAYNSQIYCGLVACVSTNCNQTRSPVVKSSSFKFEIKVVGDGKVKVTEGSDDKVIMIVSNFPPAVFCDASSSNSSDSSDSTNSSNSSDSSDSSNSSDSSDSSALCEILVRLEVAASVKDIVCPVTGESVPQLAVSWMGDNSSLGHTCGLKLTNSNWNSTHTALVRAVADGKVDGDQERSLVISARLSQTLIVHVQNVTVTAVDTDRVAICQSINDPHMTTFDGLYYNNFNGGEFVLYRHTTLLYEVRTFYRKCYGRAVSCNCAVVVRAEDDTVRIDRCGPTLGDYRRRPPLQVDMFLNGNLTKGLTVLQYDDGKKYEIFLPTMTKVVVSVNDIYINVIVQASPPDLGHTEGLCGKYDHNKTNDLTSRTGFLLSLDKVDEFSLSWRVKRADSLYTGLCGQVQTLEALDSSPNLCSCRSSSLAECGDHLAVPSCLTGLSRLSAGTDVTDGLARTALSAQCFSNFDYEITYIPQVPSWPTPSGWTLDGATKFCRGYFSASTSAQACLGGVTSLDMDPLVAGCVEDIQIMDNTDFAAAALVNLQMRCLAYLQTDLRYWVREGNQVTLNTNILRAVCPADCNQRGNCTAGTCSCSKDYGGADCSVNLKAPPTLSEIPFSRFCDQQVSACPEEVVIYGSNFYNSASLTCHLRQITILKNSINVSDDVIIAAARFINFNSVACRVSPISSYAIAISNNGQEASRYYNHFVFNSSCVTCSLDPDICSLAQDACFINNICYSFDQLSPDNGSQSCQPFLSQTMFTTTQNLPRVTSRPTMSVSVNTSSNETQLACSLPAPARTDLSYFVDVYYGKKFLLNLIPHQEGDVLVAYLSEEHIDILRFTQKIFCTVSACLTANCNGTRGPARTSNILTAGFQITGQTGEIHVNEGALDGFILVTTSLPPHLYCLREDRDDCYISIYTSLVLDKNEVKCPGGQRISQLVFPVSETHRADAACSHRLTTATWKSGLRIRVQGTVDQLKDGDQIRQVEVMATTVVAGLEFDSSLVGHVTIVVKDGDRARRPCQSTGDPHVSSFDGKRYNNYFQGEFILVRHRTLPIEVRTLQRSCNGKAACSCGVAVKSWDDVIVLDRCQAAEDVLGQPLVPKLYLNGNLTDGTRLLLMQDGSYQINLPTGMTVQAHPATNGAGAGKHDVIDIYVLASSADFEQTEGLCGTYDNDDSNDFLTTDGRLVQSKNEFILTWRVTDEESIYSGVCPTDPVSMDTRESCDCSQGRQPYCSPTASVQTCQNLISGAEDITHSLGRTVSMDACIAARQPARWSYNLTYTYTDPTWPTPSGISGDQATAACRTVVETSQMFQTCQTILRQSSIDFSLDNCQADIQILDDLSVSTAVLANIQALCLTEVSTNLDLWITDASGQVSLPPAVLNAACPRDCQGHGRCMSGWCNCSSGWLGVTCGTPSTQSPTLQAISSGAECDQRLRSCEYIDISGVNFANSQLLTCHIKSLQNNNESSVTGQYITDQLVRCRVSQTGMFRIAVSNNGRNISNYLSYVSFDSVCDNCTAASCSPRTNVCRIGGLCYADGYYNPNAPSQLCQTVYSVSNWTNISASRIEETRVIFTSINQTHLSTTAGVLQIYGQLTNITYQGKFTVVFGGSGGISLGSVSTPCLGNLELCHFGMTLSLLIRFTQLVEGGYLLTSCADDADSSGVTIYYKQKRLYFVVTTRSLAWTVYLQSVDTEHFHQLDISWSLQAGLKVYLDQQVVAQAGRPDVRRPVGQSSRNCGLTLGTKPSGGLLSLYFEIQILHIVYADKALADHVGIVSGYPQLYNKPRLTISVDELTDAVNFTCTFERLKEMTYAYYISFLMDNQTLLGPAPDTDLPVLSEHHLTNLSYGSKLSCQVSVCSAESCSSTRGADSASQDVIVQFELQTNELVISEGETGTVSLLSTVPPRLLCPPAARESCQVQILTEVRAAAEIHCPDGRAIIPQVVLQWPGSNRSEAFCGVSVGSISWRQPLQLVVKGVIDSLRDTDQRRTLVISAVIISTTVAYTRTEHIGSVQVTIKDGDRTDVCSSLNDPHITTFDGRTYNLFLEGEFVLYKHVTLPYVVHAFYKSCNGRAACNCAVAVRVHDDVVVLDKCSYGVDSNDRTVKPLTVTLYRNDELDPGFRIYQSTDHEYSIYLPNGDVVYVSVQNSRRYRNFINIWVQAAGASFAHTEGLCGRFDGNGTNDLQLADGSVSSDSGRQPNNFSLSWRVADEDSIFNGFCGADSSVERDNYFCECPYMGSQVCSQRGDVFQCAHVDASLNATTDNGRFRKDMDITRSLTAASPEHPAQCTSTEPQPLFTYNTTYVFVGGQSNITLEAAAIFCQKEISTMTSADQCSKILGQSFQYIQKFCIDDYMITEDTIWSQVAIANIRKQCLIVSHMDVTLWVTDDDGIPKLPDVVNKLCPSDCSNHGNCSYGTCACGAMYAGDDCSLDLSKSPEMSYIQGGPLCDSQLQDCSSVLIYGAGFVPVDSLRCQLIELKATTRGYEATGNQTIVKATYIREGTIACSLANYQMVNISCANIEKVYSTVTLTRVTYNSLCQTCDPDTLVCSTRTNVCRFGDLCYEDGFINPNNSAQQCSLANNTKWTQVTVTEIERSRWDFLQIVNNTLITNRYNLTLVGSPQLVRGEYGGLVLSLNGLNQYAQYPIDAACPWDVEKCRLGFTASFHLKILEMKQGMTIFSSGADEATRYGLAMWISHGRLYLRVSTRTQEWTVVTSAFRVQEFMTIKFSWSVQTGLRLYLRGQVVASQLRYTVRRGYNIQASTRFTVGANLLANTFSPILIDGLDLLASTETTAAAVNLSFLTPTFDQAPTVETETENGTSAIKLLCRFTALQPQQQEQYMYTVTWYRNQSTLKTSELGNESVSILQEAELGVLDYGDTISCGVSACISADCNNSRGPERLSDALVAELTIDKIKVTVREGEGPAPLTVRARLPPRVFCPAGVPADSCVLLLSALFLQCDSELKCLDQQRAPQAVLVWHSNNASSMTQCAVTMNSLNWQSGVTVSVQAGLDGLKDGTQRRSLEVTVTLQVAQVLQWARTVGLVEVEVKDEDVTAECQVVGDPHLTTIDSWRFNNYLEGEFVLFRNREQDYEVRVFLRSCTDYHSYASCVCAVAVRSQGNVFVVDKCGAGRGQATTFRPMTITAYLNGDLTHNTRIVRLRDNVLKIKLASGADIILTTTANLGNKYMNVFVRPSVLDMQKVEGLCGNFDGDRDNDQWLSKWNRTAQDADEFSAYWRITELEESIYTGVCLGPALTPAPSTTTSFCDCCLTSQTCSPDRTSFSCSSPNRSPPPSDNDITLQVTTASSVQNPPSKCFTSQPVPAFEYNLTYVQQKPSWPTGVFTFDLAVLECRRAIEAKAVFESCRDILGEELTATIDTCVLDVQLSGNLSWTRSAVTSFIHRCQTLVELRVDLWLTVTVNGTQVVRLPQHLLDVLQCPDNCTGHGQCLDGGCQCYEDHIGADCSTSVRTPPQVLGPAAGVCDVRQSDCVSVSIVGSGFVFNSNLVCYIQEMERVNNTFVVPANSTYLEVPAVFISAEEVTCSLPASRVYSVVVSNVRSVTVASAPVISIAYDAVCYDCSTSGCRTKSDICIIDGACYGPGFVNRENAQQTCVANTSTWTNIARAEIQTVVYSFITIDVNLLVTKQVNFTVSGNPQLVNLSSNSPSPAVRLNGVDQFINVSSLDKSSCLWEPSTCRYGFSVSFGLKVLDLKEGMYIFTSGGDGRDSCGVAMFYRYGRFVLTVSTHTQEWTVLTDKIVLNVAVRVQYSWSVQFGLSLYLDGVRVASTTRSVYRTAVTRSTYVFYLGRSITVGSSAVYTAMIIEGWALVNACKEIEEAVLGATPATAVTATRTSASATTGQTYNGTETTSATAVTTTAAVTLNGTDTSTGSSSSRSPAAGSTTSPTCLGPAGSYPTMPGDPSVSVITSGDSVFFDCTIQPATGEAGSPRYILTWTTGSQVIGQPSILTTSVVARLPLISLTQPETRSILDYGLTCSVTAENPARCGAAASPPRAATLSGYAPKVTKPTDLLVVEGSPLATTVTVSFGEIGPAVYCLLAYGVPCTVTIQARTDTQNLPDKCIESNDVPPLVVKSAARNVADSTCGGPLSTAGSVRLEIYAVSDGVIRDDRSVTISVYQVDTTDVSQDIFLDKFEVTVRSNDGTQLCKLVGDPHLYTFDNTKYDVMLTGEFVVHKHDTLPVQVNVFLYKTGVGSSVCGVSVRAGNDVIRVSKCATRNSGIYPITVDMFLVGDLTPRTRVFQEANGDAFKIFLFSGTVIEVKNSVQASLNLYIRPAAGDFGRTKGLCGVYDGNKTNDLLGRDQVLYTVTDPAGLDEPDAFSQSWSVSPSESLYDGYKGTEDVVPAVYCNCDVTGTPQCDLFGDVALCGVSPTGIDITETLVAEHVYQKQAEAGNRQVGRRRRQAAGVSGFTDVQNDNRTTPTWPTASGITKDNATKLCNDSIRNMEAFDVCVQYSDDGFLTELRDCVTDILRTDSVAWASSSSQSLQKSCLNSIAVNSSTWVDPNPGSPSVLARLSNITNRLCLNNCSNNGVCVGAVCRCDAAYTGPNCSVVKSLVPVMLVAGTSSICASSATTSCNRTTVIGTNFVDTNLTCHLTPITVTNDSVSVSGDPVTTKAVYQSQYQVVCPLPQAASYSLRISNNGRDQSRQTAYYLVYDPQCSDCQLDTNGSTPTCRITSGYCLIDSTCYTNGRQHASASCLVCDVSKSVSSWTPTTAGCTAAAASTSQAPRTDASDAEEFNSATVIIVTSCIAGLAFMAIIFVAVLFVIRWRRARADVTRLSSSSSDEGSTTDRVYDGSRGLRTDKSLLFHSQYGPPKSGLYHGNVAQI